VSSTTLEVQVELFASAEESTVRNIEGEALATELNGVAMPSVCDDGVAGTESLYQQTGTRLDLGQNGAVQCVMDGGISWQEGQSTELDASVGISRTWALPSPSLSGKSCSRAVRFPSVTCCRGTLKDVDMGY
jgi:hypothetical protein